VLAYACLRVRACECACLCVCFFEGWMFDCLHRVRQLSRGPSNGGVNRVG
jgi:hypothetical protein